MCVFVCVHPGVCLSFGLSLELTTLTRVLDPLKLLITSGVMWHDMDSI